MHIQHTRRTVLTATLGAGLLVPLTPATAEPETVAGTPQVCGPVSLPVPAGTTSEVTGGDLTGRFLVGQVRYAYRSAGALWRNGRFTEIDASSIPNVGISYHDVNRDGVVVGERMTDLNSFHTDAFRYRDGTFTFLPALRVGDSTEALGINSRGDVVGNSVGDGWRPVVWPADEPGTVRALPFPAGHPGDGRALGIDEDGSVVGYLSPYPPGTPYLWPAKGKPRVLPVPADSIGGDAVAIQGGMVAGNVYDPAGDGTVPALWNLRTGVFTPHTYVRSGALSVNGRGTIGAVSAIVHADGRVWALDIGARVNTMAETGDGAGSTVELNGQAVRWLGC